MSRSALLTNTRLVTLDLILPGWVVFWFLSSPVWRMTVRATVLTGGSRVHGENWRSRGDCTSDHKPRSSSWNPNRSLWFYRGLWTRGRVQFRIKTQSSLVTKTRNRGFVVTLTVFSANSFILFAEKFDLGSQSSCDVLSSTHFQISNDLPQETQL